MATKVECDGCGTMLDPDKGPENRVSVQVSRAMGGSGGMSVKEFDLCKRCELRLLNETDVTKWPREARAVRADQFV